MADSVRDLTVQVLRSYAVLSTNSGFIEFSVVRNGIADITTTINHVFSVYALLIDWLTQLSSYYLKNIYQSVLVSDLRVDWQLQTPNTPILFQL